MQYSEKREGAVLLLEMKEPRLEASNAGKLRELLFDRIEKGNRQIVLDLAGVTFMDSSALGSLIGAIKRMGSHGTIVLSGAAGPVLQLLKLTRMDKVFSMYPTAKAALSELDE